MRRTEKTWDCEEKRYETVETEGVMLAGAQRWVNILRYGRGRSVLQTEWKHIQRDRGVLGSQESSAQAAGMAQGEAGEAEAGAGEPLLFFSLPMQDLGLEPGFRKMASRDPLETFGGRSQLGGRAPVAWIHHSPPISEKELLSSTRKGAISQYSFVFFRLYYSTVYIHFI